MSTLQIGVVIVALAIVAVAAVTVVARSRAQARRHEAKKMPHGADAALWSIVEAMPDPRNHLALTRDLTGEVRVTEADRSLMDALAQRAARRETVGATAGAGAQT